MQQRTNQNIHIKQGPWRSAAILLAWLLLAVGVPGNAWAVDEAAYLNELDAEAESSAHLRDKQPAAAPAKTKNPQTEFEAQLKAERPNTFKFYMKLSVGDKAAVLKTYSEEGKLPPAARKVLDLYFK